MFCKHRIDESLVIARRRERLALPNLHPHLPAAPSAASPAEPAIKPDVIIWYILASLHSRQREPTALLCRLHNPSAALPSGPTPDVIVWYVLTPAQSQQCL